MTAILHGGPAAGKLANVPRSAPGLKNTDAAGRVHLYHRRGRSRHFDYGGVESRIAPPSSLILPPNAGHVVGVAR